MRPRNKRSSRCNFSLDLRKLYLDGLDVGIFRPIDSAVQKDADFEVNFCQEILRRAPEHIEALTLLGEAYTKRGEYAKGLETDLRLSRIRPENAVIHYNLACSYALVGKKEEAIRSLGRAVELGYRDLEHLRNDRDLEILKSEPRYWALVEKLNADRQQAGTK